MPKKGTRVSKTTYEAAQADIALLRAVCMEQASTIEKDAKVIAALTNQNAELNLRLIIAKVK